MESKARPITPFHVPRSIKQLFEYIGALLYNLIESRDGSAIGLKILQVVAT